ncbi:4-(cytidine 5'-diphospho)-2-C-methyl-D-erythritol kinase [Citroniella saccharovorans]|nr:4-(cytidine 5'-diphospho)-2-C-methyl-D-erythritol kinase [Citroniella saccharovorans]
MLGIRNYERLDFMSELILDSFAKVNLSLDVINKRQDNYHNIATIFQEIDLRDGIYISNDKKYLDGGLNLTCDDKRIPTGENNLVFKAWNLMKDMTDRQGVRIHIEKNIPLSAGLAGGSSNAAATVKGLNEIWNLNLSSDQMINVCRKLGADVSFFILGGTCLGEGIGDVLTPLKSLSGLKMLLVNAGFGVSSKYVYENLVIRDSEKLTYKLADAINNGKSDFYKYLNNDLEDVTLKNNPDIIKIKENMRRLGSKAELMCGSGPTVFGIFEDDYSLDNAFFFFKDKYDLSFKVNAR